MRAVEEKLPLQPAICSLRGAMVKGTLQVAFRISRLLELLRNCDRKCAGRNVFFWGGEVAAFYNLRKETACSVGDLCNRRSAEGFRNPGRFELAFCCRCIFNPTR